MSRPKPLVAAVWLMALLALLAACGGADSAAPTSTAASQSTAAPATEQLNVVATFSILGDFAQNVGGERIVLHTLVGAGGDAHTFEPSPADGVALAEADLIVENGLEFEPWLGDLYTASGSKATRVVVTERIAPIKAAAGTSAAEGQARGELDPHVWSDAGNAILMVETIRDTLVEADPANAETYTANAERYLAELKQLDSFVVEQTNQLPATRRKLVTTHDTFGYFAKRYGYEIVGTALGSISTEVADPSAGEMAELIEQIKAAGVPAIFAENVQNSGVMRRIASEAGVALGPTLYTDALGEPGSDGDTYIKMLRYNVTSIVTALGK